MRAGSLTTLSDADLARALHAKVSNEREATADVLAHIAEFDARRLYAPAGYRTMFLYCVHELGYSDDAAWKRIQAAKAAHEFPAIFTLLREGRLHLTGIGILAPHLRPENAEALLAAAAGRTKSEIELLIAQRFPKSEVLPLVMALGPASEGSDASSRGPCEADAVKESPGVGESTAVSAPAQKAPARSGTVKPLAPQRFAVTLTIGQETYERLQYAQALLSHANPSGNMAVVMDRALRALITQLEKHRFAATTKPRRGRGEPSEDPRHIPAHVKRAVWERDGGRCTFVSETGHPCEERALVQYDHADPLARGGRATVPNVRLLCSTHNRLEAERTFGVEFMRAKQEEAQRAASEAHAKAAEAAQERVMAEQGARDVMSGLRNLGFRRDDAARATEYAMSLGDAPLEERVRAAIKFLCPKKRSLA